VKTLPAVFAVGTLAVVALLAVLGFGSLVPVAVVVGWLLLTPLSGILAYVLGVTDESDGLGAEIERETRAALADATRDGTGFRDDPTENPLATLRDRYARGEIDEIEFERRVERLLETEDVDVPPGATLDPHAIERDPGRTTTEREPARER
jgi:hypothetical protein